MVFYYVFLKIVLLFNCLASCSCLSVQSLYFSSCIFLFAVNLRYNYLGFIYLGPINYLTLSILEKSPSYCTFCPSTISISCVYARRFSLLMWIMCVMHFYTLACCLMFGEENRFMIFTRCIVYKSGRVWGLPKTVYIYAHSTFTMPMPYF